MDKSTKREMKILCLGLPRTGTASMARALEILGYENVYHGLKAIDTPEDWDVFERACDAAFPHLPSYDPHADFSRKDWDLVFGSSEAATDVASVFARQLIAAYPQAKIVLVQRDFAKWFRSIDEGVLVNLWGVLPSLSIQLLEPLLGSHAGIAARKSMLGLFKARNYAECRANARRAYDEHYATVRELVPDPDRRLDYSLGDGWAPLCAFLGKDVPDVPFPHVNEAAELKRVIREKVARNFREAAAVVAPWFFGGAALVAGVGAWYFMS